MEFQQKIQARLASDPVVRQRRAELLAAFVTALERGGVEEATALLTRPVVEFQRDFDARLAELERLL